MRWLLGIHRHHCSLEGYTLMALISTKLRQSAKGQTCTFQIVGICSHNTEQTVLCHIRDESKGLGNKASDYSAAFGCLACHDAIDQHRLSKEDELFYSIRAMQRTWDYWIRSGLIVLPGDPDNLKRRPKKKSKWPSREVTRQALAPAQQDRRSR